MHSFGLVRISITSKNLNVLCFKWEGKCLPYLDDIACNNFSILGSKKALDKNLGPNFIIFGSYIYVLLNSPKRNEEFCFLKSAKKLL